MNPIFNRSLKALCTVVIAGVLSACGSSSTVDPFTPTRVIGLGDAYNDTGANQSTVRGTTALISTVVGQMAVLYGAPTVESYASSSYASTADLLTQVNQLGNLSETKDLVVITAGTQEFLSGNDTTGTTFITNLKAVIDLLKLKGAKHIVVMTVVDISLAGTYADPVAFNITVSSGLGSYRDVLRYGNINRPSAAFPGWAPNTTGPGATPYCSNPGALTGCALGDTTGTADIATYFLADNLHPTPAGNQWLGQQLYLGTGGGWR
jgi:lysophospholipase L1-like esterase